VREFRIDCGGAGRYSGWYSGGLVSLAFNITQLTFASIEPAAGPMNPLLMDALLLGPALIVSFTVSLIAGKAVLLLVVASLNVRRPEPAPAPAELQPRVNADA
jgi:hypothetical protein